MVLKIFCACEQMIGKMRLQSERFGPINVPANNVSGIFVTTISSRALAQIDEVSYFPLLVYMVIGFLEIKTETSSAFYNLYLKPDKQRICTRHHSLTFMNCGNPLSFIFFEISPLRGFATSFLLFFSITLYFQH